MTTQEITPASTDEMVLCPSCKKPFQRVAGPCRVIGQQEPNPENATVLRLNCICKNRSCKAPFTVRLHVLI